MEERKRVILSGLLHDIGKFYMRTGLPAEGYGRDEWREDHGAAGAHARWSASFFSQHVPSQWREAGWLALTHHAPKDPLSRLVQEADHLAARFDRERRPTEERGDISRDRLEALLEQIALPRRGRAPAAGGRRFAHPLRPLRVDRESVFPSDGFGNGDLRAEYAALWDSFVGEVRELKEAHEGREDTFDSYVTTLLSLLEKYTWCVPSATYRDYPNVPLYDHLKVTAAIAGCLHATGGEARFLFVEGDLSGIQAFLYETAAPSQTQDGVAKRLRGKSFFLDLVMRTLAERCRQDLGLTSANLLWCTGGHFALVTPDTPEAQRTLQEFRRLADQWCWEEFLGDIGFLLAVVPAGAADLLRLPALLHKLGTELAAEKARPFATRLGVEETWSLPLRDDVCHGCGRDAWRASDFVGAEEGQKKCPRCRHFEAWGGRLPETHFLALQTGAIASTEGVVEFPRLGMGWLMGRRGQSVPDEARLVLTLVDVEDPGWEILPGIVRPATAYGVLAYRTALPRVHGEVQTFTDMADAAEGAKFLGVLRMDVDNLGGVFALGVPQEKQSLSRLAALSRLFDWFFRGYVPLLAAQHNAYVTYSGGDDVFLVGPWDQMLDLAVAIQKAFTMYACGNPDLTVSGGLALAKRKFPIGRAAELAGDMLQEIAKTPRDPATPEDTEKASLALFNRKVPWPVLLRVKHLADRLILPAITGHRIRRGALHQWLRLSRQYFGHRGKGGVDGAAHVSWLGKLRYLIVRNVEDERLAMELLAELPALARWMPILVGYAALRVRRTPARMQVE